MKTRNVYLVLFSLLVALILAGGLWAKEAPAPRIAADTVSAQAGRAPGDAPLRAVQTPVDPATVRLNIVEPLTLDPSLATSTGSVTVIEQLFIGLVDHEDDTGNIQPELATSWAVSADATVYTFTLRSDVVWSDGTPVTAADARYGILRTLDPATGAGYAYPLYVIRNAADYNFGNITNPDEVGVTVLDDTHLRITLERPASYMLSILAMWMARPMPQHVISMWGEAWSDPEHLVTNGAYELTEWVAGDHIALEKSPTYFDAANVSFERVQMMLADSNTAWQMYLAGELDTAAVPLSADPDPTVQQEVRNDPGPCVYEYRFSVSQPPFDNPLVRRAFSAATDRRGLVRERLPFGPESALTVTPPTLFGHVDGYAEGVGHPYDPSRARQLLADAGYPDGQGLPPITLWYNTSTAHQSIAEYVSQRWEETFNIDVELQDMSWQEYLSWLEAGSAQIYRIGWCADYMDAYNFVGEHFMNRNRLGGWTNDTYEQLLDQVARETDPATRQSLYRQIEEILVETDAISIPIYHYGSRVATKPYLERTYPGRSYDISDWYSTAVSETLDAEGGTITSYDGDVTVTFPADTFSETVTVGYAPATGMPPAGELDGLGVVYQLTAVTGEEPVAPNGPYTVTISYDDSDIGPIIEETLALYYWDGESWTAAESEVNTAENTITASLEHFSLWTVLGETERTFLPAIRR